MKIKQNFDEFEKLLNLYSSPGIRPGLSRIEALLELIGEPQRKFRAIHVVGTNGKGSTCSFINSILIAAGYKTAFYSSPHLVSPDERLLIDGKPLSSSDWVSCANEIFKIMDENEKLKADPPSYFEILTAVAFKLIEKASVDVAIVEAGLGGRFDATNTLGNVLVSVITSISMDHTEFLGSTLEKIASEKFAVVRAPKRAVYLGDSEQLCRSFDGNILLRDSEIKINKISLEGNNYGLKLKGSLSGTEGAEIFFPGLKTGLIGEYQIYNSALAVSAVLLSGLKADEKSIREGLLSARWIGRMEIVSRDPLVIFDGGHNEDGVKKLTDSIKKLINEESIGIVYAAMKDKDIHGCFAHLSKLENPSIYLTQIPGNSRSADICELEKIASGFKWKKVLKFENPNEALELSKTENYATVLCGSLYFIGYIKSLF